MKMAVISAVPYWTLISDDIISTLAHNVTLVILGSRVRIDFMSDTVLKNTQ